METLRMRALIEAVGSPVWGPLLPRLREAADFIAGVDITPLAWGLYAVDAGRLAPRYAEPGAWDTLEALCRDLAIDTVFPSINEGLSGWAERRDRLAERGVRVVLSPADTVATCADKWKTYEFFQRHGIPTPATSLAADHALLKPRIGRGGTGIRRLSDAERGTVDMAGFVTQEIVTGQEYSVDALCEPDGRVCCVVVRERLLVESGVSIRGRVVAHPAIEEGVRRILAALPCFGPVDIQCFDTPAGVRFTEINPRLAGGLSLSMAATGNWFVWIREMLEGRRIGPKPVTTGLVMMRRYEDVILHERDAKGPIVAGRAG
jgi:carbamoyl-phosphate synthase large subunit